MNDSELFIRHAALAARNRRGATDWASLPIGERVTLIYREMRRTSPADVPLPGTVADAGTRRGGRASTSEAQSRRQERRSVTRYSSLAARSW